MARFDKWNVITNLDGQFTVDHIGLNDNQFYETVIVTQRNESELTGIFNRLELKYGRDLAIRYYEANMNLASLFKPGTRLNFERN